MPRKKASGLHELVRLARLVLDTAKVEDLAEMLHFVCPSANRKMLLAHFLVSSSASYIQQMLTMIQADALTAGQVLIRVVNQIVCECAIGLQEQPDGAYSFSEEKSLQGAISRVVLLEVGETCAKYAEDLVRLGLQLPLWTSRDMARFSSSPNLQEKVVNWFVASLSDQLLLLLQGCCLVSDLQLALKPKATALPCVDVVAESMASAEVFRECLLKSTRLLESRKCVESLVFEMLQPEMPEPIPHCMERFACILGGAFEAQVRYVETVRPDARLHYLWRMGAVSITWRFLKTCWDEEASFLTEPGLYNSWKSTPQALAESFLASVITPMMEEEHRAAERAADEAMAELLAEELEAKRKCDSGAGELHRAEEYSAWPRLAVQLLMLQRARSSP